MRYIESIHSDGKRDLFTGGDGRFFLVGKKRLFMIWAQTSNRGKFEHHLAEFFYNESDGTLYHNFPQTRLSIEHEMGHTHQKNWAPFTYPTSFQLKAELEREHFVFTQDAYDASIAAPSGELVLFVYSIIPHRIVAGNYSMQAVDGANASYIKMHTVCLTEINGTLTPFAWKHGSPRGGTPAVYVNDTIYGPRFVVIFHSSCKGCHYAGISSFFMGGYLFNAHPPFDITHFSPDPLVPNPFYNESFGWAFKNIDYVILPMGISIKGDTILVSAGKNDKNGWFIQMSLSGFIESLIPVASTTLIDKLTLRGTS